MQTNKLPQGWVECEFEKCINKINPQKKVKQKEYLEEGVYPVIDQGQELVGGYSNNEDFVLKITSPVIVFGDHTRCFKYINFDFIVGADGTKILKPLSFFDEKLFYYFCKIIQFPDKGYSRHYQYLAKSEMRIPPLNEQKRIVEKIEEEFGKIEEGIEKLKLAQEQIKQYRQSVLKSAFDGKLYKTTEWDKYTIKDVSTNIQYGYTESASSDKIGPKFLRITDIQNNSVNWDKVPYCRISDENKPKYLLKNGDFVFARTGATVGKSYMIQNLNEEAVYASYLIRIGFGDNIETKFIKYYFQTNEYWTQIADNQVGIGQPNVNGTKLGNLTINLPTLDEQKQIVKEIEKRFEVADEAERVITENLEKAEQLKQSILKKAFEGRLVPQDPTDEPASELLAKIKAERNK